MHIQRQLENVLISHGVSEIAIREGDEFDTRTMEAIENKECPPEECKNVVKKVVVRGYKMGERIVRPARVVVE
jgi:molecular chaperone GrpE (heat shock protein)